MAGENQTIGLRHRTADGMTSLFTGGGKQLRDTDHNWSGLEGALGNAGDPAYIGFFDDFLGAAIVTPWVATKTGAGTIAINAQGGGAIRFTSDTGATDDATLALGLHFLVSNGWTVMRAGVQQVSAVTARKVEIGFNDANSETAGLAFSSVSTPTAVAANAAVFAFNTAESITTYSALSVKASGTPQKALGVATPSSAAYQHFALAIDSLGNAYFYTGEPMVLVATLLLAVATTAVLTPWIALANTTTAAKSLDVDYVSVYGKRGY